MTMAEQQEDKDDELVIPAHIREQGRRECEGSALSSTDACYSHTRWVFVRNRDRGANLKAINYRPVEFRLRKLLALLNWRRWWL
jgi:hypothetical protein